MTAEARRAGSRSAALSPGRLFAWVLVATLVLDAATALRSRGAHIVVETGETGRLAIGLAAGCAGMRDLQRFGRVVGSTWAGMMAATLLVDAVYVLSGQVMMEHNGPGLVVVQVLFTIVIGAAAPAAGGLARIAVQRLAGRRG